MNRVMHDLISRKVLLNDLCYCAPELWHDEEYIRAKIELQPTVEAAPVIHGRWVISPPTSLWPIGNCSVCGEQHIGTNKANYCPHCGAKMDGERTDS